MFNVMKNKTELDKSNLTAGLSRVVVMQRNVDEVTKRETIAQIHEGVVVQNCGAFVRVFNPEKGGGDAMQETARLYAVAGLNSWIEKRFDLIDRLPLCPMFR